MRRWRVMAAVAMLLAVGGCKCCERGKEKEAQKVGTTQPADDHVMSGRVVSEPPAEGRVGIERWRFQPEGEKGKYLRLTRVLMQEARPPESGEIDLNPYAGKDVRVKYQRADDAWVWGAQVVE